jgi:hypothetical protein
MVQEEAMTHGAIAKSLDAYVDGTLPLVQRAELDAHLRACMQCGESLQQVHRLELILDDLPSPPEVPFPRFWSKLEERLSNRVEKRAPLFRPGRMAAAFALAVLASLIGVVALASDAVMPDSALYPVKHLRQEVQLVLTGANERPGLELAIARQRLHEALLMVQRKRPDLALASIKDFHALLVDASSRLEKAPDGALDKRSLLSSVGALADELAAVRDANIEQEGTNAEDIAALDVAVHASLNAVNRVAAQGGAQVVESPAAEPSAAAGPSPSDSLQPAQSSPVAPASPPAEPSAAAPLPPPADSPPTVDSRPPSDSSMSAQPAASSAPQTSQPAAAPSRPVDTASPDPTD